MVRVLYCMKIASPRWAKSLSDGTAWFGSVESYIQKLKRITMTNRAMNLKVYLLEYGDFQMRSLAT